MSPDDLVMNSDNIVVDLASDEDEKTREIGDIGGGLHRLPSPEASTTSTCDFGQTSSSSSLASCCSHCEESAESESDISAEDYQKRLRIRIMAIQKDGTLDVVEKAKRVQDLMSRKWEEHQRKTADSVCSIVTNKLKDKLADYSHVTASDAEPSYFDVRSGTLGCKHYQRDCKLQAHCCGRWFPCRFCHDEVSDHNITRNLTTTMMCMHCKTVQPAAQNCTNCGECVSRYYCAECKLWDSDPSKSIYHCGDCGICRIGKGLGEDYFHCKKCNVCMAISLEGKHKCIERNLESDCPICGEYMFTSTTTVIFMPCGHCIHYKCHQEYIKTNYQCPTCFKSLADMRDYFGRIDEMLAAHEMPAEYTNWVSFILCNDCEKKSETKYHFLYHKCAHCASYNTKILKNGERKPGQVGPVFSEMAKWMKENGMTSMPLPPSYSQAASSSSDSCEMES